MVFPSQVLSALSGVLLALCLPRPGLCFLAWGALVPLFLAIRRGGGAKGAFFKGWAAGFAFHGVAFYWIYSTCRFAQTPAWVGALAWSALCAFLGLQWALTAAVGGLAAERLRPALRPWAWAVVWTALYGAATAWGPRLCADLLEYTQYRHLALIQIASVFGPHGLGFLIVLINAVAAEAWGAELDRPAPGLRVNAALCALLLVADLAWGRWQLLGREPLASSAGAAAARIEILQPNIDQYQKWDEKAAGEILAGFDELLAAPAATPPRLIVWPESSIPRWVEEGKTVEEPARWSKKLGAYQVVGVVSTGIFGEHNAAFEIGPDGALIGSYFKRELVPFGEYVPFPFLKRYIGILAQMGGLSEGAARQPLFETPFGPTAATICYEAMFPRWARLDASRGARVILNVTNDGWYKDTWGPYQHFYSNVFRAVENRVTVIRSGNTGISAVVDPWGVVTARLDLGARGRLDADVPLGDAFPSRSFYARHGDWFAALCAIATAALLLLACGA